MITEKDLQEAIAECQGERNPNANTCIKLAAYYTILDNIRQGSAKESKEYSYAPAPIVDTSEQYIDYVRNTEFSRLIDGRDASKVWEVMDELMQTLKIVLPPMYNSAVSKIKSKA